MRVEDTPKPKQTSAGVPAASRNFANEIAFYIKLFLLVLCYLKPSTMTSENLVAKNIKMDRKTYLIIYLDYEVPSFWLW